MYGKIFAEMYDGTLADNWEALVTFQQMIVLCDSNGIIDVTPRALASRTGIPIEIIDKGIAILERPDPQSRSAAMNGQRIHRLDEHRDWGWQIVNHEKYRDRKSAHEKREKDAARAKRYRERRKLQNVTERDENVTERDESRKSRHTDTDTDTDTDNSEAKASSETLDHRSPVSTATVEGGEPVSLSQVIGYWNSQMGTNCRCTDGRRKDLRTRLNSGFWRDNWKNAIDKIAASDFCRGKTDRGTWKATLDWLLKPDTLTKVMEGKYDNKENGKRLL